ncbi:AI-2E family transporter [[Clostridium] hylemonae]|uniref:AI-2E family transporter n=1 Tax=[Clostridium] hylemonae TaxID=89153 RepID=UPI001106F141|nr:AI-2E family transporter [[Clostridium] hylemonae]
MDNENKNNQEDGQEKSQEKGKRSDYYAKQPRFGGKGPSKIRQQFNRGMTAFLVVAASILFYFALLRLTNLSEGFTKIFDVLKPVIYGCVFAYLMNPIVKQVDNYLRPVLEKKIKKHDGARKLSRACGIFLSIIILFVLIITLCNLLIPELYSSIRNLVFTLPGQLNELVDKLNNVKLEDSTTGALIKTAVEEGTDMLQTWLRTDLLTRANDIMSNLTVGVISIISEIINALIGIIISIYILFSKETFSRQSKKTVYALMKPEHGNMLLHLATKSNEIFGGFIIGKIIDSLIIGVLCFMGLSILNMPYTVLVSVIIGVTNVIPFFGPYIGAIPSAVLILLSDPVKGIYFILFVLLLQQFDGNILGPKILGDSTGLSAFWVIVAILLGGGLFGFVGMIMGVPTFAVIYYIVQMILNNKLERKKLPADSKYYDMLSYVDNQGKYIHSEEYKTEKKESEEK